MNGHNHGASFEITKAELDPRDNVSVRYSWSLQAWTVCRNAVVIERFNNQVDALGYARRLCDGEK